MARRGKDDVGAANRSMPRAEFNGPHWYTTLRPASNIGETDLFAGAANRYDSRTPRFTDMLRMNCSASEPEIWIASFSPKWNTTRPMDLSNSKCVTSAMFTTYCS